MSTRRGAVAAMLAVVIALAVVVALAGCAAAPTVRTSPNRVERQAVEAAAAQSGFPELAGNGAWVQLWTPEAAGYAITQCASAGVKGLGTINGAFDADGRFGWSATFGSDNGSTGEITASEMEAMQLSVARCVVSHPVDLRLVRIAASRRSALYAYDVTVLRRCLLAHGQNATQAPSRGAFLAMYRDRLPLWSPYDDVVVRTRAQWYALADACPALPAGMRG